MGKLSAFLKPAPAGRTKEVFLDRFTDEVTVEFPETRKNNKKRN